MTCTDLRNVQMHFHMIYGPVQNVINTFSAVPSLGSDAHSSFTQIKCACDRLLIYIRANN